MKTRALFLRVVGVFFCAFLGAGLINVFPQILFQRYFPAQKKLYLSIFLVTGTLSAIVGLWLSHRVQVRLRQTPKSSSSRFVLVGLLLLSMFLSMLGLRLSTTLLWIFSLHLVVRFGVGFLLNFLDITSVQSTPIALQNRNSQIVVGYRLLGMLVSPPFFALLFDRTLAMMLALGSLTGLALLGSWMLLHHGEDAKPVKSSESGEPSIQTQDLLVTGFGLLSYVCFYTIATNLIYYLKDVIKIDGAEAKGAFLVMGVFLMAIVSLALSPRILRMLGLSNEADDSDPHSPTRLSTAVVVVPVCVFAFSFVLWQKWVQSFSLIVPGAIALGALFGFFMFELRRYMAREAFANQNVALMSLYNNIPNVSSLVAFLAMLGLSLSASYGWTAYFPGMFVLLMIFSVLNGFLLLWLLKPEPVT